MKNIIITILLLLLLGIAANAKPHCQGFNNYDDKVTIVFTDDNKTVIFLPTFSTTRCDFFANNRKYIAHKHCRNKKNV